MRMQDLIEKKKNGFAHTGEELSYIIGGAVDGLIPDYQLSAWLMAVCFRGMSDEELASLTDLMARSGDTVDLSALGDRTVDKHSTGGVERNAELLRNLVCRFQKLIACSRCKRSRQMILGSEIGVGASAESRNHVLQTELVGKRARRTDTDDIFHVKKVKKLIAVDRHGGHTHAARHDGNLRSLVSARVSLDSADVIDENGILQIGFCNKFRAERISGHEDRFGEIAFFCCNMRCCHNFISFLF